MKSLIAKTILLFIIFFGGSIHLFAQEIPEVTPLTNQSFTPCTDGDNCYQLLESLPWGDGEWITGLNVGADPTKGSTLGDFINLLFQLGIGIAGVLAVVMLTIYGFQYASGDTTNIANLAALKVKITNVVIGLLLLLSTFVILNTINPDLTLVEPDVESIVLNIHDRASNPDFVSNLDGLDVSGVSVDPADFSSELFLAYLSHQQGAGGAASILWAARQGYTSIPSETPFIRKASIINRNMQRNVGNDYRTVSGQNSVTPSGFLTYWAKKVNGFKNKPAPVSTTVDSALRNASARTGVAYQTLLVMCTIESRCNPSAVNGSYSGLFQMGKNEFTANGGTGNIFDPLQNSISAGNYMKKNLATLRGWWGTITR